MLSKYIVLLLNSYNLIAYLNRYCEIYIYKKIEITTTIMGRVALAELSAFGLRTIGLGFESCLKHFPPHSVVLGPV